MKKLSQFYQVHRDEELQEVKTQEDQYYRFRVFGLTKTICGSFST